MKVHTHLTQRQEVNHERDTFTCLEAPGLVRLCSFSSFSKRLLFLETSSSRNRVRWVTSGDRAASDFWEHTGSWAEQTYGWCKLHSLYIYCCCGNMDQAVCFTRSSRNIHKEYSERKMHDDWKQQRKQQRWSNSTRRQNDNNSIQVHLKNYKIFMEWGTKCPYCIRQRIRTLSFKTT